MDGNSSLKLTDREIASALAESICAERYPPILTIEQAASLLQVPVQTIYRWRSRGHLGPCYCKIGKHLCFYRGRLIKGAFDEGLSDDE